MKYPLEPRKDLNTDSDCKKTDESLVQIQPIDVDKGVMKQIKKVVKKFREKEKH